MNLRIFRFDQNRLWKWFPTLSWCSLLPIWRPLAPFLSYSIVYSVEVVIKRAPTLVIPKWPNSFLVVLLIFFSKLLLQMNLIHIQSSKKLHFFWDFNDHKLWSRNWLGYRLFQLTQWSLLSEQETLDSRFLWSFVWQKCFKSFRFFASFSIVFRIK